MFISEHDFIAARNTAADIAEVMNSVNNRSVVINHRVYTLPRKSVLLDPPTYLVEPEVDAVEVPVESV